MSSNVLSIIIPAFNEEGTIEALLEKVLQAKLPGNLDREVIIVNDCSTDRTEEIVQRVINNHPESQLLYCRHEKNQGKGAALHTGIAKARGGYLIVQDADLEYDPNEYERLLKPMIDGHADVVYGSRFMGSQPHRILFFWHSLGNQFLTFLSNALNNINLTDMECCYKLFRTEVIKSIKLQERRFGFEPEVTAKMARIPGIRIYEVGVSYYGRTYEEGKKVGWKDGFRAIYCILKYGIFKRS